MSTNPVELTIKINPNHARSVSIQFLSINLFYTGFRIDVIIPAYATKICQTELQNKLYLHLQERLADS